MTAEGDAYRSPPKVSEPAAVADDRRDSSGRYVSRSRFNRTEPVPVTCRKCGTETTGPIWYGTVNVSTGETWQCLGHTMGITEPTYMVLCDPCASVAGYQGSWRQGRQFCCWCRREVGYGGHGGQPHAYCTDECQYQAYAARRAKRRHRSRDKVCKQCRTAFKAARADSKFCSPACRQKWYRRAKATRREEQQKHAEMLRQYNGSLQ